VDAQNRQHGTIALTYDDANRRATLTFPSGVVATSGYDADNRLTSLAYTLGQTPLGDLQYAYDAAGQRTSVGGSWGRTGLPQALASGTYDSANRIATVGGTGFGYDTNGNLTDDGPTTYTWNARNQLVAVSGAVSASFAYDGLGRRRSKTINGTATSYLYDGLNFVQEQTGGGTPTANLLTGLEVDEVFRRTDTDRARDLLADAVGSILEQVDQSGTLQTHYTYEPFGATAASGTSSTNAIQFTGRENDGTGTYFYRARHYAPVTGGFLAEDPAEFTANGPNLYWYAGDNPINNIDPSGCGFVDCGRVLAELMKALWNAKDDLLKVEKTGKCDAGHQKELEQRRTNLRNKLDEFKKHCRGFVGAAAAIAAAEEALESIAVVLEFAAIAIL
jgi:RHS repeat-associated protein